MIRTILMLGFWGLILPLAALVGLPWTYITRDIRLLYWMGMKGAFAGIRIADVKVEAEGLERFDHARTYLYMSNHTSNLDPPLQLPLIPRRTSVMAKQELFRYPILGEVMRLGSPVRRKSMPSFLPSGVGPWRKVIRISLRSGRHSSSRLGR